MTLSSLETWRGCLEGAHGYATSSWRWLKAILVIDYHQSSVTCRSPLILVSRFAWRSVELLEPTTSTSTQLWVFWLSGLKMDENAHEFEHVLGGERTVFGEFMSYSFVFIPISFVFAMGSEWAFKVSNWTLWWCGIELLSIDVASCSEASLAVNTVFRRKEVGIVCPHIYEPGYFRVRYFRNTRYRPRRKCNRGSFIRYDLRLSFNIVTSTCLLRWHSTYLHCQEGNLLTDLVIRCWTLLWVSPTERSTTDQTDVSSLTTGGRSFRLNHTTCHSFGRSPQEYRRELPSNLQSTLHCGACPSCCLVPVWITGACFHCHRWNCT